MKKLLRLLFIVCTIYLTNAASGQESFFSDIGLNVRYGSSLPPVNPETFKTGLGSSFHFAHAPIVCGTEIYFLKQYTNYDLREMESRVTIPFHFGFSLGNKIQWSAQFGPFISFHLAGDFEENIRKTKEINIGIITFTQLQIFLSEKAAVFLKYDFTWNENSYYYQYPSKHSGYASASEIQRTKSLFLSLGLSYRLNQ